MLTTIPVSSIRVQLPVTSSCPTKEGSIEKDGVTGVASVLDTVLSHLRVQKDLLELTA